MLICVLFKPVPSFPDSSVSKESIWNVRDPIRFLGQKDLLEKG